MGMFRVVKSQIKTFNKKEAKKDTKMCLKCGCVLELDKECGCEREGKTKRSCDSETANN